MNKRQPSKSGSWNFLLNQWILRSCAHSSQLHVETWGAANCHFNGRRESGTCAPPSQGTGSTVWPGV
jgi:hypothetical protein